MPDAAVPPVLLTITVVADGRGEPFSVAVTVTVRRSGALRHRVWGPGRGTTAVGATSSSVMVPVAVPASLRISAFTGLLSTRLNVSSGSCRTSSTVTTVTVLDVSPGEKVRDEVADA